MSAFPGAQGDEAERVAASRGAPPEVGKEYR